MVSDGLIKYGEIPYLKVRKSHFGHALTNALCRAAQSLYWLCNSKIYGSISAPVPPERCGIFGQGCAISAGGGLVFIGGIVDDLHAAIINAVVNIHRLLNDFLNFDISYPFFFHLFDAGVLVFRA